MMEKSLYWIPRIFTILALMFMMMFSFDVFEGGDPLSEKLQGFIIHNVPVLVLTGILIIAWKWELPGGILLIAASFVASIIFRSFSGNPGSLIVVTPFFMTGVLFILHNLIYGKSVQDKMQKK